MASAEFQSPPWERLRARSTLRAAWRRVDASAHASSSPAIREAARRFGEHADKHLARVAAELGEGRFTFAPARGVAQERPGKRPRPLVIAPLESRIVQRAILDVLLAIPEVSALCLGAPTSFGGLPGRGVEPAITAALEAVRAGSAWYLRSDIPEFFRRIPRREALSRLAPHLGDDRFARALDDATRTEIDNLAELGEHAALFPDDATGVPQGCALSTLLGNVLLADFDAQLNGRGVTCLRYVDDFLILGGEAARVRKAFASGGRALEALGLSAYDPERTPEKAAFGHVAGGLEFLGCEIREGRARPGRAKREELLGRVESLLARSERFLERPDPAEATRLGLAPTLGALSRLLEGFRGAYRFCDADDAFAALDRAVDARVEKYLRLFRTSSALHPAHRGSLRGVFSLAAG